MKLSLRLCGHFRKEIEALASSPEFEGVELTTYSPFCEWAPGQIAASDDILLPPRDERQVLVVGACFLGPSKGFPAAGGSVEIHREDHCLYLFAGKDLVDSFIRQGAYLLTPGWLELWPRQMERWGFDQPAAKAFFRESATRVVLLDTLVNPESEGELAAFARHIDLPFERIPVGLSHLKLSLLRLVRERQLKDEKAAREELQRRWADQAMALDLLGNLTRVQTEEEAILGIRELFAMLFGPRRLNYIAVRSGRLLAAEVPGSLSWIQDWLDDREDRKAWRDTPDGFVLKISHLGDTTGVVEVGEIAFPEHRREYVNLALTISRLCGLAVHNARLYEDVERLSASEEGSRLEGVP